MRCKKHPLDLSSSVGVCASCLRERLFSLIAAQVRQAQLQSQVQSFAEDRRKSDAHPPPPTFPRSVSPYICRRSDDSSWHHHNHNDRRFYSTPQVGPFTTTSTANIHKKKHSKFSLFSLFTSSRSNEPDPDPRIARISRASLATSSSSPISSSWLSSLVHRHRKKQSHQFCYDEASPADHQPCRSSDRRMPPEKRRHEEEEDYQDEEAYLSANGYPTESSPGWRKQATAPPFRRKGLPQHSRSVSGLAFCLSPLVRASPNSHRNQKGAPPEIGGFQSEIRVSNKPLDLSTAASLCANRSRKLADFGRFKCDH